MMKPGCGRQSFLVVFDFDHTVCDCNTDEVIPAILGRADLQRHIIRENGILNANYGHDDKAVTATTTATATEKEGNGNNNATAPIHKKMQWTKLMDTLIAPFSRSELDAAARETVKIAPGMTEVFDLLMAVQEQNSFFLDDNSNDDEAEENKSASSSPSSSSPLSERLVTPNYLEVSIASDSNLAFIETALDATLPGVRERISQIHSNPYYEIHSGGDGDKKKSGGGNNFCPKLTAEEEEDEAHRDAKYNPQMTTRKSRLLWYERNAGSGCEFCTAKGSKPNMCKSKIIKKLLSTTQLIDPTVIFVGDGGNDYCPVLNVLRPRDFVFVRAGFPLHRILSTGQGGEHRGGSGGGGGEERVGGCCSIGLWKDPTELLSLFRAVLVDLPFLRLPTIARFLDVAPPGQEFRAVTVRTRLVGIAEKTLRENEATVSAAGHRAVLALRDSCAGNGLVPPLPGQFALPAWLRNYAFVNECTTTADDNDETTVTIASGAAGRVSVMTLPDTTAAASSTARVKNVSIAPRWGQLPWLHGEIYFYTLLWQCMMLRDTDGDKDTKDTTEKKEISGDAATTGGGGGAAAAAAVMNYASPYDIINPLSSQECSSGSGGGRGSGRRGRRRGLPGAVTQGLVSAHDPSILCQSLDGAFIIDVQCDGTQAADVDEGVIARTIHFRRVKNANSNAHNVNTTAAKGVEAVSELIPSRALMDASGNSLLPSAPSSLFRPYDDIFAAEKRNVLVTFIRSRVAPMAAARPWSAPRAFAGTLLRWCLWGNGFDPSVFTVEQLAKDTNALVAAVAAAKSAAAADAAAAGEVSNNKGNGAHPSSGGGAGETRKVAKQAALRHLRDDEATAAAAQDGNIAGSDVDVTARYLRSLLQPPSSSTARGCKNKITLADLDPAKFRLDVVMDNVGVECVADVCLGLWFLNHARRKVDAIATAIASTCTTDEGKEGWEELTAALKLVKPEVTYHVKSHPYYVSDVTPRDFDAMLAVLEETYTSAIDRTTTTKRRRRRRTGKATADGAKADSPAAAVVTTATTTTEHVDAAAAAAPSAADDVGGAAEGGTDRTVKAKPAKKKETEEDRTAAPTAAESSDQTKSAKRKKSKRRVKKSAGATSNGGKGEGETEKEEGNKRKTTIPTTPTAATNGNDDADADDDRALLKALLRPFVAEIRSAFATGGFAIDADAVWTQPAEFRDLPPRVVNRYFFTQTCTLAADSMNNNANANTNITPSLTSRGQVYTANKAAVRAKTAMVIFKGDLNFRKVVGDRHWEQSDFLTTLLPPGSGEALTADGLAAAMDGLSTGQQRAVAEVLADTPQPPAGCSPAQAPSFSEVVSAYWPVAAVPLVSIRTIKSESCIGVSAATKAAIEKEKGAAWRYSGKYGVILMAS